MHWVAGSFFFSDVVWLMQKPISNGIQVSLILMDKGKQKHFLIFFRKQLHCASKLKEKLPIQYIFSMAKYK